MNLTTQECILTYLLDCGISDLSMLDDINYDLDGILDDLIENNCLSLNNLLEEVFKKGISELKDVIENKKDEIEDDLKYLIRLVPSEDALDDDVQRFENELTDDDLKLLQYYGCFEWKEDIQNCLDELQKLNPTEDIEYYCNCLATSIRFINHEKTYRRLFATEIEEIENNMGFSF